MNLGSLLKPDAVKIFGRVSSKKRLMQEIGDLVSGCYGICAEDAVVALQDRESIGPTGVGEGVALPHARLQRLDEVVGTFVKLESPLEFDSVDRQPVDLVFALFAPEDTGVKHLKALAVVSRALRDPSIRNKLRANDDPSILHAILTDSESIKAA